MKGDCLLDVIIREIETEAAYDGTVYDQTIVLELLDEGFSLKEISVFDSDSPPQISDKKIGERCQVTLSVLPGSSVSVRESALPDIRMLDEPISKWSYTFVGGVSNVDRQRNHLYLDLGEGCIVVEMNNSLSGIIDNKIDDNGLILEIPAARTNLLDISFKQ